MRWLDSLIDSRDMNLNKLQEIVEARGAWRAAVHGLEPDLTQIAGSLLSLLRSVRSRVLRRNGTPLTSQVVQG